MVRVCCETDAEPLPKLNPRISMRGFPAWLVLSSIHSKGYWKDAAGGQGISLVPLHSLWICVCLLLWGCIVISGTCEGAIGGALLQPHTLSTQSLGTSVLDIGELLIGPPRTHMAHFMSSAHSNTCHRLLTYV